MNLISAIIAITAFGTASTAAAPALFNPFKSTPAVSKDQCFREYWLDFKYKGTSFECRWQHKVLVMCRNEKENARIVFYAEPNVETVQMDSEASSPTHLNKLKAFMHEYATVCNPGAKVITESSKEIVEPFGATGTVVPKDRCFRREWLYFKYGGIFFQCRWDSHFVLCKNQKGDFKMAFFAEPPTLGHEFIMYPKYTAPTYRITANLFMLEYAAVCNPRAQVFIRPIDEHSGLFVDNWY